MINITHMDAKELVRLIPPLGTLNPLQINRFAAISEVHRVPAGQPVKPLMGARPPALYLAKGACAIEMSGFQHGHSVMRLAGPQTWINLHVHLGDLNPQTSITNHHAIQDGTEAANSLRISARAIIPTVLVALLPLPLIAKIWEDPTIAQQALTHAVNLANELAHQLALQTHANVEQRTIWWLYKIRNLLYPNQNQIQLPFPQATLAKCIGCSRETLTRTLIRLEQKGAIVTQNRWISIQAPLR